MVNDSRARIINYLCQAGLSTARANAVIDEYTAEIIGRKREPVEVSIALTAETPSGLTGSDSPPMAPGCEHWRREHRADLCPMGTCRRCRYVERL